MLMFALSGARSFLNSDNEVYDDMDEGIPDDIEENIGIVASISEV